MYPKNRKPPWWQLYVGLPLLSSLFVFEIDLHLDQTDNIILQLMILALIFMFMRVWLRANRGALMEMDEHAPERQEPHGIHVYQFPPAERVTPTRVTTVRKPLLNIPEGEIRGVLSTTFEMDAEPADSVFQPRAEDPGSEEALPPRNSRHSDHREQE